MNKTHQSSSQKRVRTPHNFQYYKNIAVDADVFFRLKGDAGTDITFAE